MRDAPPPAESPETLARLRALSPPPFEPAPPPPRRPRARRAARAGRHRSGRWAARPATRGPLPQIRFEHAAEGFRVLASDTTSVFRNPVIDHTYSWCGGGSLRFDSSFDLADPSVQSGEAVIYLPRPVDLRGKTVTVRFMVRAPVRRRVLGAHPGGPGRQAHRQQLQPAPDAPAPGGRSARPSTSAPTGFGTFQSDLHNVDRIILKVDATGSFRVWSGPIYIDDIGWR